MNKFSTVTVAAAQYGVEFLGNWETYAQKVMRLVSAAAQQDAQILVFPEYACLELASLFSSEIYRDMHRQLDAVQLYLPAFIELHCALAQQHHLYIVASSFPVQLSDDSFRNRAYFCKPDGTYDFQDKLIMTRFENEVWSISPGDEVKVFDTAYGKVGITICYDAEFPLIARRQAELGAQIILAPSCTDSSAGYNRVRIGCRARALENQCYVVMAPVVGVADWSPALDVTIGAAGVYSPVDTGFPSDGVLAMGELNAAQWVIAELDLHKIEQVRQQGEVLNYQDWVKQTSLSDNLRLPLCDLRREVLELPSLVSKAY